MISAFHVKKESKKQRRTMETLCLRSFPVSSSGLLYLNELQSNFRKFRYFRYSVNPKTLFFLVGLPRFERGIVRQAQDGQQGRSFTFMNLSGILAVAGSNHDRINKVMSGSGMGRVFRGKTAS